MPPTPASANSFYCYVISLIKAVSSSYYLDVSETPLNFSFKNSNFSFCLSKVSLYNFNPSICSFVNSYYPFIPSSINFCTFPNSVSKLDIPD
uniref:Uncharacterized protein n=1 Tax=Siphoviridae sp. ctxMM9 TaxID=2827973 RepID=A0A8S5T6R4_9CAUD|nr:MAG TPA: hypothetical protein [Siphoviridae sp. ctxMM9]